jgi:hypothetical protein
MAIWKIGLIAYLMLGTTIILATRARKEVLGGLSNQEIEKIPTWKVVIFYCLTTPIALLFWPVFLHGWLRRKVSVWDVLQQPKSQGGSGLKELYDAMDSVTSAGCDADEIPGAEGEFGWDSSNPVPTHTTFGSTSYLARLRTPDDEVLNYERVGSFGSPASEMPVDGYELTDTKGHEFGILYLSPYHRRNSKKAPAGLVLVSTKDHG